MKTVETTSGNTYKDRTTSWSTGEISTRCGRQHQRVHQEQTASGSTTGFQQVHVHVHIDVLVNVRAHVHVHVHVHISCSCS
jgi:hypothetical protein